MYLHVAVFLFCGLGTVPMLEVKSDADAAFEVHQVSKRQAPHNYMFCLQLPVSV